MGIQCTVQSNKLAHPTSPWVYSIYILYSTYSTVQYTVYIHVNHGGIINGVVKGVNCVKKGGGHTLCSLHRAEGLYAVRLGTLQGLYERFLIRSSSHTGWTVQARAPLYVVYFLYDVNTSRQLMTTES